MEATCPALTESDTADPINHYGKTKLEGENAVLAAYPTAWVARVSWVFGPEKASFVETILDRAARGESLAAIDDKFSCPTFADDAAVAFDRLLALSSSHDAKGTPTGGLIHICNPGPVSWYDYAAEILRLDGLNAGAAPLTPQRLKLSDMKAFRVPRPVHTAMSVQRLRALTGHSMRPWKEALAEYISKIRRLG